MKVPAAKGPTNDESDSREAVERPTERGFALDIFGVPIGDRTKPVKPDGRWERDASESILELRAQAGLHLSVRQSRRLSVRKPRMSPKKPRTSLKRERDVAWLRWTDQPPRYAVGTASVAAAVCVACGETSPATPWVAVIGVLIAGIIDLTRAGR